ncbi:MAG: hypothetical protein IJ040_08530 [Lachnospiraceae bacterium]|nr:hypothetical protein [Lachnospiraceae bacterium]
MILYFVNQEHETDLEELQEDIHVRVLQNQDMQQLFRQELQHLTMVSHIIVEAEAINRSTWKEAAASLRAMKRIPLLLIVDDEQMTDSFLREENYDVMNRSHKDIQEMLQDWLRGVQDEDMNLNHTWIAVAGLTPGAGATALSMHLATYIHRQQLEVSVTERADIFRMLAYHYGWEELAAGSYQWGGIIYNHNQIDESSPYTIFDLGTMTQKSHAIWKQCQIKILVVDGKPYRLQGLSEQLQQLRSYPGEIILAFTFVPDAEKPALKKKYSSDKVRVWFVPMQSDLFIASDEYQDLVQGYVVPVPVEKKIRKVVPFQIPKIQKGKIMIGSVILLSLCIGFGMATTLHQRKDNQYLEVAVESIPRMSFSGTSRIRLMLAEEQAATATEMVVDPTTEAVTEAVTEATTEVASTESIQESTTGIKHLEESNSTEAPVAMPPATEEPTTEATQSSGVIAPLMPSVSGYQGQIYTGSQVISIMNKFGGQPVAIHLITRSSDGWYNYSTSGSGLVAAPAVSSGTALVDPQCSFLCQVIYVNGEGVGLEFVQQ